MSMLLVIPDPGAIVVDGSLALRTASLGDALAGRTSRSGSVQLSEDQTSRGVTLPPGRLSRLTRRCALPELLGVATVGGVLIEG